MGDGGVPPNPPSADPGTPSAPPSAGPRTPAARRSTSSAEDLPADADDVPRGVDVQRSRELLVTLSDLSADDPQRDGIRKELATLHLPLAEHLARRFTGRGEPYEDLVQVATIGLIKAIDRYDHERGVEFSTYATPTILGEIKRWFRDKGWAIRVPRRLQELRMSINAMTTDLTQRLGRSPSVREIAKTLSATEEEVLEALESGTAYNTVSLDAPEGGESDGQSTLDTIGSEDAGLERVEDRAALSAMLSRLPERERKIVLLRFFHGMTQSQIATEVGISQMHVSRLLSRSLTKLRTGMSSRVPDDGGP